MSFYISFLVVQVKRHSTFLFTLPKYENRVQDHIFFYFFRVIFTGYDISKKNDTQLITKRNDHFSVSSVQCKLFLASPLLTKKSFKKFTPTLTYKHTFSHTFFISRHHHCKMNVKRKTAA